MTETPQEEMEQTGGFKSQDPNSMLSPSYLKMIRDQVFKDTK